MKFIIRLFRWIWPKKKAKFNLNDWPLKNSTWECTDITVRLLDDLPTGKIVFGDFNARIAQMIEEAIDREIMGTPIVYGNSYRNTWTNEEEKLCDDIEKGLQINPDEER